MQANTRSLLLISSRKQCNNEKKSVIVLELIRHDVSTIDLEFTIHFSACFTFIPLIFIYFYYLFFNLFFKINAFIIMAFQCLNIIKIDCVIRSFKASVYFSYNCFHSSKILLLRIFWKISKDSSKFLERIYTSVWAIAAKPLCKKNTSTVSKINIDVLL